MLTIPLGLRRAIPVLLLVPSAGAQDLDIAERLYHSGDRAYATRSYQEAMETWGQLIQQAPKSEFAAQALLRLARHQLEVEHKPEAALPLLDRLKAEHIKLPVAASAMYLRGCILADRARKDADLKEAMGEFNRVVDLFPGHPILQATRYRMGLAWGLQHQWGRALASFTEVIRLDPGTPVAAQAQLQCAEILDLQGDLPGCLRLLQSIRNAWPQAPEAQEAEWRIQVRVLHRIRKAPLASEGPWPQGRQSWLKTPTLLATGRNGELFIFQDDLDRAYLLKDGAVEPVGPTVKSAKAMAVGADGVPWLVSGKLGLFRGETPISLPLTAPSGLVADAWGQAWISDARQGSLMVVAADGTPRTIPSPAATALAALPTGGVVAASDANRSLLFLDAAGQPKVTVPYGKDLPAPFKSVLALCSDPLGHVAAIVDGDFEGVVLWGPDGSLLRQATFKGLGISGKFRSLALDRKGGIILADRSKDMMIRLH